MFIIFMDIGRFLCPHLSSVFPDNKGVGIFNSSVKFYEAPAPVIHQPLVPLQFSLPPSPSPQPSWTVTRRGVTITSDSVTPLYFTSLSGLVTRFIPRPPLQQHLRPYPPELYLPDIGTPHLKIDIDHLNTLREEFDRRFTSKFLRRCARFPPSSSEFLFCTTLDPNRSIQSFPDEASLFASFNFDDSD